ncbi:hypothetical protein LCGC14_0916460 [marine sediment metagenome]|uniref:Uncharacterized protein n=1 Tax=marine sediment metagenome TaxID=412755 RepID=A0A0F9RAW4_9ZZZZ
MHIEGIITRTDNCVDNIHHTPSITVEIMGHDGPIWVDREVFPDLHLLLPDAYVRIEAEQRNQRLYATRAEMVPYDTMVGRGTKVELSRATEIAEELHRAGYRVLVHPVRAEPWHHKHWWGLRQGTLQEKRAWLHVGNNRSEVFAGPGVPMRNGPTADMVQYLLHNYPPISTDAFLHQGTLAIQHERDYVEQAQRPSWHTRKTT